jgi:hypothetical protein
MVSATISLQAQETVFVSLPPCLVFDTRPAFGGPGAFAPEQERTFHIVGTTANFAAQGGTVGGCGVPGFGDDGPVAKAVFINYVAISPQGAGQIKAWAATGTEPEQGALVNYQLLSPPMNNSNAVVTELRQDEPGDDIKVKAKSAGVHVRGVVLGYFTEGHITAVMPGTGLTGGATQGTAILGIAPGGVDSTELADGSVIEEKLGPSAVTTGAIEDGAVTGPKIANSEVVREINGLQDSVLITGTQGIMVSTAGSAISISGADAIAANAVGRPRFFRTVHDLSKEGQNSGVADTSMVITEDGLPLIVLSDEEQAFAIKLVKCRNVACTSVDVGGSGLGRGRQLSVAIGSDGFPIFVFRADTGDDIKVIHCNNSLCSGRTDSRVLGSGFHPSIVIGADGFPLISWGTDSLWAYHCSDAACDNGTPIEIDQVLSRNTSITIGADGFGLISYRTQYDLKVAHCSNRLCSTSLATTVFPFAADGFSDEGFNTSITTGTDGLGLVAFFRDSSEETGHGDLMVVQCAATDCSAYNSYVIDSTGDVGRYPALTIGSDGMPLISYYDATNGALKVAHCGVETCAVNSSVTVDDGVQPRGKHGSLAIGPDGFGLLAFTDEPQGSLITMHLSNVFGVPYFRRR